MFCKYCGYKLADDANFCPKCGKLVLEPEPEITVAPLQEKTVADDPILQSSKKCLLPLR